MPLLTLARTTLAALALTLLTAGAAFGVVIDFDSAPAEVGRSADSIYATTPGVLLRPAGVPVPGGGAACFTIVETSPLASGAGAAIGCGGGEFPPPKLLHAVFTTKTYQQVGLTVGSAPARSVQLYGYDSAGAVSALSPVTAIPAGGRVPITISAGDPEIAAIVLRTVSGPDIGALVVDDIDLPDPPLAGAPNLLLSRVTDGTVNVVQGTSGETELALYRINGSSGAVDYSFTGLPPGVSATVTPSVNGALARFTAAVSAPAPKTSTPVTITATPQNAGAGPAARSAIVPVAVYPAVELSNRGITRTTVPGCTDMLLDYVIRPNASPGEWRVTGLPDGVSAFIDGVPLTTAPAAADGTGRTVRLTFQASKPFTPSTARITLAGGFGFYISAFDLRIDAGTLNATVSPGSGTPPERLGPGTRVTLSGDDLCNPPGSRLRFGNDRALTTFSASPDGRTITAEVPRLATTGPISLVPDPARPDVRLDGPQFTVNGFREREGFAFRNYTPNITFANMEDAFGYAETHVTIDPCPIIDCEIVTPIPDPRALIMWGIAEATVGGGGGGVCFGLSRTSLQFRKSILSTTSFPPGNASTAFGLAASFGASAGLTGRVNANQLTVLSKEMVGYYLKRGFGNGLVGTNAGLRAEIEAGLRSGTLPAISLREGGTVDHMHVVTAYDLTQVGNDPNEFFVWVYDSNRPFRNGAAIQKEPAATELDPGGANHQFRMETSRLHVRPDGSWSLASTSEMSAGPNGLGYIVVFPDATEPRDPTLITSLPSGPAAFLLNMGSAATGPGEGTQAAAAAGDEGAWALEQVSAGGKTLLDPDGSQNTGPDALAATPWSPPTGQPTGIEGAIVDDVGPVTLTARGRSDGAPQTQSVIGPRMIASVTAGPKRGQDDATTVDPKAGSVGFDPEGTRAAETRVMVTGPGGAVLGAELTATAAGDGTRLAVRPSDGRLTVVSDGGGPVALKLSRVANDGATAAQVRTRLRPGQPLTLAGSAWRSVGRTGTLPFRAGSTPRPLRTGRLTGARIRVQVLSVTTRGKRVVVKARVRTSAAGSTTATAVLRKGRKAVGTDSEAVPTGARTAVVTFTLPKPAGRLRLTVAASRTDTTRGVPIVTSATARRNVG